MQPIDDLQTKFFILTMERSIQSLKSVDISLLSSRWNERSFLRFYDDNFEDSTDLVKLEEVGFSCCCHGK